MSLNIEDEDTRRLVQELAEMTGESHAVADTTAVRERRDRLRRADASTSEDLLHIGRDVAARLPDPWSAGDRAADLYDDRGLPA